jgi:CheY-like chemotaxis protein
MATGQTKPTIIVIDADAFEATYASSMLDDLGVNIVFYAEADQAIQTILRDTTIRAAIIGSLPNPSRVISNLSIRRLPYLLLLPANSNRKLFGNGVSVLAKPFAAYQVADWVHKTLTQTTVTD